MGAQSAQSAQQQNIDMQKATNALNYQMFLQSRGAGGSSLLPMYFTGTSTEQNLANQAWAQYLASQQALGSPTDQMARYNAIAQGAMPAMQAGDALVNQLFSGQLADQMVANVAPVQAARGGLAEAQKQGTLEALSSRLDAIAAERARAGYSGGGGTFEKNLLTGAAIPAFQQAAQTGAQARLANAMETANIRNQNIQQQLGSLNVPLAQAANRVQLSQLPQTAAASGFQTSMQPFNWFKMNPQAWQAQNLPLVQPIPSTGQIVGQGISSGLSSAGDYYARQQLANQLAQSRTGTGTGGGTPFTMQDYMQQQAMQQQSTWPNTFDYPRPPGSPD
jgi:hypothetical protein